MAGEVITSPAPLVGYHPPWQKAEMPEEPDYGKKILNAFAIGVQANQRRQALEQDLSRLALAEKQLQYQDKWHEKEHGYKMESLERRNDINEARLLIAQDNADVNAGRLRLAEENAHLKAKADQVAATGILNYRNEIAAIDQEQYPIGTERYDAQFDLITDKHIPVLSASVDGGRIVDDLRARSTAINLERSRSAQRIKNRLDMQLKLQGKSGHGLKLDDLGRPEEDFVFRDGRVGILEYPDDTGRYQTIDLKAANWDNLTAQQQSDNYPNFRWRDTTEANYRTMKDEYDLFQEYASGDFSKVPGHVDQGKHEPSPANPAQRVVGKGYDVGKGRILYWLGNGKWSDTPPAPR